MHRCTKQQQKKHNKKKPPKQQKNPKPNFEYNFDV